MKSGRHVLIPLLGAGSLGMTLVGGAQISLTGPYSEDFDTVFAEASTTLPAGWSAVSASQSINAVGVSDETWAGRQEDPVGTIWAYNAALQTDVTRTGDGLPDRGLAIYSTDAVVNRYIQADFFNGTGSTITGLQVSFNVALYAARYDSDHANQRWDGLRLLVDDGRGFLTTSFEAIFEDSEITFANDPNIAPGGSPWNANGWGWATAAMIPGGHKKPVNASLTGLDIPPGGQFTLRWVSKDGAVAPTPGTGDQKSMLVGVDDVTVAVAAAPPVVPPLGAIIVNDGGTDYLAVVYDRIAGGTGTTGINYTADGIQYTVESNSDLGSPWNSGFTGGGYVQVEAVGSPVENGDGTERVTVRLGTPISEAPGQYARLRIQQIP